MIGRRAGVLGVFALLLISLFFAAPAIGATKAQITQCFTDGGVKGQNMAVVQPVADKDIPVGSQRFTSMYAFKVAGYGVGLSTVISAGGGITVLTVLGYRLLTRRRRYVSAG
jgi:hypothetical protein